jgi:hypothetical protein
MDILTQIDLDAAGCDNPRCTHDHSKIYLIPSCHPRAGISALYDKPSGTLEFECRRCRAPVAVVAVAHGAKPS